MQTLFKLTSFINYSTGRYQCMIVDCSMQVWLAGQPSTYELCIYTSLAGSDTYCVQYSHTCIHGMIKLN